jgi:hypothetical protein
MPTVGKCDDFFHQYQRRDISSYSSRGSSPREVSRGVVAVAERALRGSEHSVPNGENGSRCQRRNGRVWRGS